MKLTRTSLLAILIAAAAALLAIPTSAFAATPAQVIRDARDGSIDGTYTAAELRAADAQINAQEREYTDWDYLFQNALRRLANPDEPKAEVVTPRDFDGDGVVGANDVATAKKQTDALKKKDKKRGKKQTKKGKDGEQGGDDDRNEARHEARSKSDPDDGSSDGNPWLIAVLVLIPIIIVGVGVWRMQKQQQDEIDGGPKGSGDDGPDAPTSSFAVGDDDK